MYGLNSEATYNWENDEWSVPLNVTISCVMKITSQLLSIGGGGLRYFAESATGGPEELGIRVFLTFLSLK